MARIMGIDYGAKRTGIAITDSLQIAVHPYKTVSTIELFSTIQNYLSEEKVEKVVFGYPKHSDGSDTHLVKDIRTFAERLKNKFPKLLIDFQDESFSSADAKEIILKSGIKKKARRDKSRIDLISAVIILQRYLNHIP